MGGGGEGVLRILSDGVDNVVVACVVCAENASK